uniref:hypothetical protein n=1 Tax=Cardinium endosymbiont of Bemisia tabaci TaxID=672794 RepID=UPI000442CF77|nr:hypothetical protein [Cardinium endosymbiont of Bemisia tabaci]CDG50368.1 Hypothetical protein CHV_p003 [Cardinium endosymbiont cBtQ1 of Bemisia tabaci]
MSKRIGINDKKESQKSYLDDFTPNPTTSSKPEMARMSFVVSKQIIDKVEAYIRKKRMSGDIYYSKTNLIHEALNRFLS